MSMKQLLFMRHVTKTISFLIRELISIISDTPIIGILTFLLILNHWGGIDHKFQDAKVILREE